MKTKKRIFLLVFCALIFGSVHTANAQVTIGAETAPKFYSLLELNTSEVQGGLRLPQLTLAQRDALTTELKALSDTEKKGTKGLTIYNLDTECTDTWNGTRWLSVCSTVSQNTHKCGAYLDNGVWLKFMCHNLGADESLDPFTPAAGLHGAKYRYGAETASYTMEQDQSNAGPITGWTENSTADFPYQESGSWAVDPCPTGWRLPTLDEWKQVMKAENNDISRTGTWTTASDNYLSGIFLGPNLFLPASGTRNPDNGEMNSRGFAGRYWASLTSSFLRFSETEIVSTSYLAIRGAGASIRCVAD